MRTGTVSNVSWTEEAADRSPIVQRSRTRSVAQMKVIVEAAKRLVFEKDNRFTTQDVAREAGMALQTFYRYFPGKDHLLLALIEDLVTEQVTHLEEASRDVTDPLTRLRRQVTQTVHLLTGGGEAAAACRFIATERSRLHQQYPEELRHATQPFAELVARQLRAAQDAGLVAPIDVDRDAALITRLVMATYYEYAFTAHAEPVEEIAEHLWEFCARGLGTTRERKCA
jgi:TetR/AcrR family transcriptional regulator